jgi:riboflavin kinase/FMN adenylyltransferase
MQLIRGLVNLNDQDSACVATIGNFDGVHFGHQRIIQRVIEQAHARKISSCIIIFEPHPKKFFMPKISFLQMTSFREKYRLFKQMGIDKLLIIQFNSSFSKMEASYFIHQILIQQLKVHHLIVGDDFQFGYKKEGNFSLLLHFSSPLFTVEPTQTILMEEQLSESYKNILTSQIIKKRISSSLLRTFFIECDLFLIRLFLGRCYSITGKVGYGRQLARTMGYPTANIRFQNRSLPLKGVFLVKVSWFMNHSIKTAQTIKHQAWGVANCGFRPTVQGKTGQVEVHLLDIPTSIDLYQHRLNVDFHHFIRKEKSFTHLNDLSQQIKKDIKKARHIIVHSFDNICQLSPMTHPNQPDRNAND